jgi:hypothetical protein
VSTLFSRFFIHTLISTSQLRSGVLRLIPTDRRSSGDFIYSLAETLAAIRFIHDQIRDTVIEATEEFQTESLTRVVEDGDGSTIYVIDRISEHLLVTLLEQN